jgi:hypothetical protein
MTLLPARSFTLIKPAMLAILCLAELQESQLPQLSSPSQHCDQPSQLAQQITSSVEKSTLERSVDNHSQSIKIKFQKSGVKVVRDLLTKRWIFVKRDKQLRWRDS